MKVITLDNSQLAEAAMSLQHKCQGFVPELVVGIATGGAVVARAMFADVEHVDVVCRRQSTEKKKSRLVQSIISSMPYAVLNLMRKVEAWWLSHKKPEPRMVSMPTKSVDAIKRVKKILVVDDAVDSGATLQAVLNTLAAIVSADTEIKSAAITVTISKPLVMPDYYIYNNKTLIRFPWSIDMKPAQGER